MGTFCPRCLHRTLLGQPRPKRAVFAGGVAGLCEMEATCDRGNAWVGNGTGWGATVARFAVPTRLFGRGPPCGTRLAAGAIDRRHPPELARVARRAAALLDVREDAVELVETVVTHDQLALAAGGMLDGDFRTELVGELLFEALDVRVAPVMAIRA